MFSLERNPRAFLYSFLVLAATIVLSACSEEITTPEQTQYSVQMVADRYDVGVEVLGYCQRIVITADIFGDAPNWANLPFTVTATNQGVVDVVRISSETTIFNTSVPHIHTVETHAICGRRLGRTKLTFHHPVNPTEEWRVVDVYVYGLG